MRAIAAAQREIDSLDLESKIGEKLLAVPVDEAGGAEPSLSAGSVAAGITQSMLRERLQKEVNIDRAVFYAELALRGDSTPPPEALIDFDWFHRWREYAGNVSSETLQQAWGHVLAGELKKPGAFSYRTLEFLRNLSVDEARLIEAIANITFEVGLVCYGVMLEEELSREALGVGAGDFRFLEELGILASVSSGGVSWTAPPTQQSAGGFALALNVGSRTLVARTSDAKKLPELGFYRITKLGKSVLSLIAVVPREEYLLAVGRLLANDGFDVKLGDAARLSEGLIKLENEQSIVASGPPKVRW